MTLDDIPKLAAVQSQGHTVTWCWYCEKWHYHGAGGSGHRVAHCAGYPFPTPYQSTGYILEPVSGGRAHAKTFNAERHLIRHGWTSNGCLWSHPNEPAGPRFRFDFDKAINVQRLNEQVAVLTARGWKVTCGTSDGDFWGHVVEVRDPDPGTMRRYCSLSAAMKREASDPHRRKLTTPTHSSDAVH